MVTTKELETRMDSYEKIVSNLQESMQNSFEMMQKSIEGLMVSIATQHIVTMIQCVNIITIH